MSLSSLLGETYGGARVLVTGHTGFKGSWMCALLGELGAEVHGLALEPEDELDHFVLTGMAERVASSTIGDVRDLDVVRTAVAGSRPQFVFHMAAQALVRRSYREPHETFDTNVLGTVNVLEALRGAEELSAAVMVTSDKCYENVEVPRGYVESDPLGGRDPYSASKACAELVTTAYRASFFDGAGVASARAGNVIGGGDRAEDRIVPDFVRAHEAGVPLEVRSPGAVRPWQHVLEPLFGYLVLAARLATEPDRLARAFNFGPGDDAHVTVGELADMLVETYGGSWVDASGAEQPHEATLLALDVGLARRELGWTPVLDVEDAVAYTGAWYADAAEGRAWDVTLEQIGEYSEKADVAMGEIRTEGES